MTTIIEIRWNWRAWMYTEINY